MGHMGDGAHGQWDTLAKGIVVNIEDKDGVPWGMGHIAMGHMVNMSCAGSCVTSLILHGS